MTNSSRPTKTSLLLFATAIAVAMLALTLLAALGAAAASANTPVEVKSNAAAERGAGAKLKPLGSCAGLRNYLKSHRRALRGYGFGVGLPAIEDAAGGALGGANDESAVPSPAPAQNPTNVQEEGVDEPDILKASGTTIFAVDGSDLHAVDTSGESPAMLDSLDLPQGGENGFAGDYQLLIAADRLLAIADIYSDGYQQTTMIAEIDISDPSELAITKQARVEGYFVSARLNGATARIVTSSYPTLPIAAEGNGRALVPSLTLRDRVAGTRQKSKLLECADVSRPARFAGAEMLTVSTIDMEHGLPAIDVDSVMTNGQIVYASNESLYVATERWVADGAARDRVSSVDTEIHRFNISDPGSTAYVASGKVPGFMLSQWSMSEQDGLLRVASTTSPPWDENGETGKSESFVTVLATDGAQLREVGSVGGLGRSEQIYAVRFIGDTGYVVTFRQVDPLYTLDLSDPTAPRVVGELKIPGYSAYLHPVAEGYLLGVGQDASAAGQTRGVQVSLFDVTDPASPVRVDTEQFGPNSYSEVEYDHHAFAYFAEHALAMLPLESYSPEFYGAAGLRIDPGGADPIGRIGKVAHQGGYEGQIRRSLSIGDSVYTLSARGLGVHDPATLAERSFLGF